LCFSEAALKGDASEAAASLAAAKQLLRWHQAHKRIK